MNTSTLGKTAVLMGGPSAEREVSLKSGAAVLAALQRRGIEAHGIDADESVLRQLQEGAYDRGFNILHGRWGEDGVIQGALEVIGLPYTGSGVLASALAMDKLRAKYLWQGVDIPSPEFIELKDDKDIDRVEQELGWPVFVKPAREGSSLGMSKVSDPAELHAAWQQAMGYDDRVFAERAINGKEVTVAIVGGDTLPTICIETTRSFYDYEAKYIQDDTRYHCPSGLSAAVERDIQDLAVRTFESLGCQGWGRIDFMLDESNRPFVLEVNTVPGMTDHSLVPKAASVAGIDFDELVLRILETSDVTR